MEESVPAVMVLCEEIMYLAPLTTEDDKLLGLSLGMAILYLGRFRYILMDLVLRTRVVPLPWVIWYLNHLQTALAGRLSRKPWCTGSVCVLYIQAVMTQAVNL